MPATACLRTILGRGAVPPPPLESATACTSEGLGNQARVFPSKIGFLFNIPVGSALTKIPGYVIVGYMTAGFHTE